MMSKISMSLIVLIIIGFYVFFNLGNFVDVTQKPAKADIIVSLGGDYSGCRLKRALALYKKEYSKSGKLIYTGMNTVSKSFEETGSKKQYLLKNGLKEENIINIDIRMVGNTMEEVLFIKKYMLYHNYKRAMFVSHPQHSRRIKSFAEYIANYASSGLSLSVVSCNPIWWNPAFYYKDETSVKETMRELVKLVYNLVKYGTPLIKFTKYSKSNKNKEWDISIKEKLL